MCMNESSLLDSINRFSLVFTSGYLIWCTNPTPQLNYSNHIDMLHFPSPTHPACAFIPPYHTISAGLFARKSSSGHSFPPLSSMVIVLVDEPPVSTAVSGVGSFARPPKKLRVFEEGWDWDWLFWASQEELSGCLRVVVMAADDDGCVEENEEERKIRVKRWVVLESKGR